MTSRRLVVRAITAFVHLDHPEKEARRLREVRGGLFRLRDLLPEAGFEVQTLRVALDGFTSLGKTLDAVVQQVAFLLETLGEEIYVNVGQVRGDAPQGYAWLPELMARFRIYASAQLVAPGTTRIHGRDVWEAARLIHALVSVGSLGEGNTRFAASAWVPPHTPFFPAAYALPEDAPGWSWGLALETGGLLASVARSSGNLDDKGEALRRLLEEETRSMAETVQTHAPDLWPHFQGMDISWAPFPSEERSVGAAMESLLGGAVGEHGTLALSAWLTSVLHRTRLPKRAGFCGLMLPLLEDPVLARAVAEGRLDTRTLLAYSAVCGVGLDIVPLPGDVTVDQLAAVLWDIAALAVRLHKPLAARLVPVPGHRPGEWVRWEHPFFTATPVLALPASAHGGWNDQEVLDIRPLQEVSESL